MIRTSITLIGLTAAALLAGSFAFAGSNQDPFARSQEILKQALLSKSDTGSKGHRLATPKPAQQSLPVSIVEIVGLSRATVILRDSNGEVLYRSDPRSGTTAFTKNTDLPILTMKEDMRQPATQHPPVPHREGSEETRKPKKTNPIGCVADVSPLAKASANRIPSLCLASLSRPLS